jgi:hypothetical protein
MHKAWVQSPTKKKGEKEKNRERRERERERGKERFRLAESTQVFSCTLH